MTHQEPNPWNPPHKEAKIDVIAVWDWITGRKRRKLRQWLTDNRKRRRQNLKYKEPITEVEWSEDNEKC